ncbi:MAG: NAD(P)-binding domain-containing protein, partial [Phycisphaeraceae bacterium]
GEDLEHVSHYFEDPHRYFRQRLLIVGGRNSAVEAALRCHRAGAQVSLSYRQPHFDEKSVKYWLLPELKSLIKHQRIDYHPCTTPTRITPDRVTLAPSGHAACDQSGNGETFDLDADFVLLLTGYVMDSMLLTDAGVELVGENAAPNFDAQTMQTNVPGLFVAGTAAAGTQVRFRLFIENCHPHVHRIARAITGENPPDGCINPVARQFELPES